MALRRRKGRKEDGFATADSEDDSKSNVEKLASVEARMEVGSQRTMPEKGEGGMSAPWGTVDLFLAGLVLGLSAAVRFYKLKEPAASVFDEVHFGKFTNWYINREFFFDIHPPLAKLMFAGLGTLLGYEPLKGEYEFIGQKYRNGSKYFILRGISAFFGSFVPMFALVTCRDLGLSRTASLLTATAVTFENMLVVESRLILTDAQLMFFLSLTFSLAVKMWNTPPKTWKRLGYAVAVALAGCGAISVKWTAGVTPFLIALVSFFGITFMVVPLSFVEMLAAAITAAVMYTLLHVVHFKVLTKSGQGDLFLSEPFRATLIGSEWYGKLEPKGFWYNFYELTQCMFWTNKGTVQAHPYMSKWYTWPLTIRGMQYLQGNVKGDKVRNVFLIANPVVALLTFGTVVITTILLLIYVRYRTLPAVNRFSRTASLSAFFIFSWVLNLLPYMAVERSAFLYHYLPGLYYAEILMAIMVDPLPRKPRAALVLVVSLHKMPN